MSCGLCVTLLILLLSALSEWPLPGPQVPYPNGTNGFDFVFDRNLATFITSATCFFHPCGLVLLFDVTIVLSSSLSILLLQEQNLEGSNKFVKWVGYRVRDSLIFNDGFPSYPLAAPVCHACLSVGADGNMVLPTFFIFTVCPAATYC